MKGLRDAGADDGKGDGLWKLWKTRQKTTAPSFPQFPQPLLLSISKKKDALMEGLGQTGMDKSEREA